MSTTSDPAPQTSLEEAPLVLFGPDHNTAGVVERTGWRIFRRLAARDPGPAEDDGDIDEIHTLNPGERRRLKRLARRACWRALGAGALSGLATAIAEIWLLRSMGVWSGEDLPSDLSQHISFWGVVGGVTVVATGFEIAFLYWDALRTTLHMTQAAGLDLFAPTLGVPPPGPAGKVRRLDLARGLVRAALELPSPRQTVFGIDPQNELSRTWLAVATLAYKAKIGLTNFVAKMTLRRLLGRVAVKAWLPFVVIPVTGLWNAWITWRITREVRIRLMGPSAAQELLRGALAQTTDRRESYTATEAGLLLSIVGGAVVRSRDMHPNLLALLVELLGRLDADPDELVLIAPQALAPTLADEDPPLQLLGLRLYCIATIIDGRIAPAEIALGRLLFAACGRTLDSTALAALLRDFVDGDNHGRALMQQLVVE